MEEELQDQLLITPEPWLYLSHLPPHGCLDQDPAGRHLGHRPLAEHLQDRDWPPALVISDQGPGGVGWTHRGHTLMVNVTAGWAHIEWNPRGARILNLSRTWGNPLETLLSKCPEGDHSPNPAPLPAVSDDPPQDEGVEPLPDESHVLSTAEVDAMLHKSLEYLRRTEPELFWKKVDLASLPITPPEKVEEGLRESALLLKRLGKKLTEL